MAVAGAVKRRTELVIWMIIGAASLSVLPFARIPGPAATGVPGVFCGAVTVADAATAFLLLSRVMETRGIGVLLLTCSYLYSAIMTPVMLLVFPDALVIGQSVLVSSAQGNQAVSWIFQLWYWGFSVMALASVIVAAWWPEWKIPHSTVRRTVIIGAAATIITALGLSFLVLAISEHLPLMMVGFQWTAANTIATLGSYGVLLAAISIIHFRLRSRSDLFRWLELSLIVFALANALTTLSGGRYTIGWNAGRILWAVSACVVLIYFLAQFWTQQRELADARENLERKVLKRTEEKDNLIKVINHRIGNQLQVIQSMLSIENRNAEGEEAVAILGRLGTNLNAMSQEHVRHSKSDYLEHGGGAVEAATYADPSHSN